MPRSNGIFPSYVKLDISPDKPPRDWDNGCRRCIKCGKSWPNKSMFSPSPCCNATAGLVATGIPDMDWAEAVKGLLNGRFERYYTQWNENASDAELYWTPDEKDEISEQEVMEEMKDIDQLTRHSEVNK